MAYSPIPVQALVPGYPGNGAYLAALLQNADEAYATYGPAIINQCTKWSTTLAVQTLAGEWIIPQNEDNVRVGVDIYWRGTTGFTATASFEITDGVDGDNDTETNTDSAYSHSTITVTPSSSTGHPRFGRLYLDTSSAGQTVAVAALNCYYYPSTFPTGVQASGAAQVADWAASGRAIPREVMERAANNIRAVARSRAACLAGGMTSFGTWPAGPTYDVTGTTWGLVERFIVPGNDPGRRKYRLAVKGAGTDPEWRFVVGSRVWEDSGTWWSYDTPELALPEGTPGALYLRSTSGGTATISTWQLLREAA